VFEFTPTEPGDWAMRCHMTHHVMNLMGHGFPVTIGADAKRIDDRVKSPAALVQDDGTRRHGGHGGGGHARSDELHSDGGSRRTVWPHRHGWKVHHLEGAATLRAGGRQRVVPTPEGGTVAQAASPERLRSDGIDPKAR
jgi:hypothetical protein